MMKDYSPNYYDTLCNHFIAYPNPNFKQIKLVIHYVIIHIWCRIFKELFLWTLSINNQISKSLLNEFYKLILSEIRPLVIARE